MYQLNRIVGVIMGTRKRTQPIKIVKSNHAKHAMCYELDGEL
jgi:hypothetical protein